MRFTSVFIWFLLLPVAGGASAQGGGATSQGGAAPVAAAIAESHRLCFEALRCGDSLLFVSRFAADCWIMGPGGDVLCGDGAASDLFERMHHEMCVRNGRFITAEIFGNSGEFVTELGFYQLFDGGGRIVGDGTLMVLWRKTAAGWKMFRTSFNGGS